MKAITSTLSLDKNTVIPLIATGFLIATSFIPVFQVILLELFRLYTPVAEMLGIHHMLFFVIVNSTVSLAVLYQYYRSQSTAGTALSIGLAVVFLYPMLMYLFRGVGGETLYMLTFIFAALLFGLITGALAIAKQYNTRLQT